MMDDLRELYQEILLDHSRSTRHRGNVAGANHKAEGHNPLCGDFIAISARIAEDIVEQCAFDGRACAICIASASMMADAIQGHSCDHARKLFARVRNMLMGEAANEVAEDCALAALAGVRRFPMRVKCATLPWHTMIAALDGSALPISTD
ncbi:MAG: Fe-S cluster assembly sulfur transfer protein SufU [Phycisphaerales bacterium]